MKTHLRLLGVSTAVLSLGLWFLAAAASNAADEKDLRGAVLKVADTLEKKDADGSKKQAADIAKNLEGVEELMHLMSLRRPNGLLVPPVLGDDARKPLVGGHGSESSRPRMPRAVHRYARIERFACGHCRRHTGARRQAGAHCCAGSRPDAAACQSVRT